MVNCKINVERKKSVFVNCSLLLQKAMNVAEIWQKHGHPNDQYVCQRLIQFIQ